MQTDAADRATRMAWTAFVVQAAALLFHQSWHAVGFDEPPSEIGHYLLLHFPLHGGVILLAVAAVWLVLARGISPPLLLLGAGATVQHAGLVVDTVAVFGSASHVAGAVLLATGGVLALGAPALRHVRG